MGITMFGLNLIMPELYLAGAAIFMLMVAVYKSPRVNNEMIGLALFALLFTAIPLWQSLHIVPRSAFNNMFILDDFGIYAKLAILAATALVVLISADWLKDSSPNSGEARRGAQYGTDGANDAPTPTLPPMGRGLAHPSEFLVLMLLAVVGMMLMVSANDLLALYMALEMSSLALYVLASFNRDNAKSTEAGLKYFVLGALASGMMLFGMSLIYGFAGTTGFGELGKLLTADAPVSMGIVVGLVLMMVGFCFKLSAVPFHMWTPDVYEGAPTPVAAFFATAPKIAALALFARLLMQPFVHVFDQWQQVIVFASVASMLVGALAAIMQKNIKRLLAYSSIGHVGFMLMGLASGSIAGVQAMVIYMALYIFMSVAAFGCVLLMRRDGTYVEEISDLSGLSQTKPWMAMLLAMIMFSMTGIPPLAGFFGKMYVLIAALKADLAWLAVVGVVAGVIGGYYYLKVVKVMYFDAPAAAFDAKAPCALKVALLICTVVILFFFLVPTPLMAEAKLAAEALIR